MTQQMRERLKNIPKKLRGCPHWVCYRLEEREKPKPDKIPYDPKTGKRASSIDPKTWGTYEQVIDKLSKSNGHYNGIGFVFTKGAGFCGIDIDSCIKDGETLPWAKEIIDRLNSFTEISPSGDGLHILIMGNKPGKNCRKGQIEIYDQGRFFTITGNIVPGPSPNIENRQAELNRLYDKVFSKPTIKPEWPNISLSDQEIINKILSSKQGSEFKKLWEGDHSGFPSHSEADLSLCSILAFWAAKDHDKIDALFRQSGLCRDKWGKQRGEQTYGDLTISRAIEGTTETHKGDGNNKQVAALEKKDKPIESDPNEAIIEELNKKHAVIMMSGKCVVLNKIIDYTFNRPDVTFSSPTDFKAFYSNKYIFEKDKNGNSKAIPLGRYWFNHKNRRQYEGITFAPKKETPNHYNLYQGFAVEPKKGNCELYLEHIHENVANGNEQINKYIIGWMADAVKNPSERPGTSIVLRGKMGVGKGITCSQFGKLFGPHFLHIQNSKHLTGNFNSHLKNALIVFADEAFWAGDKQAEGILKGLVTEEIFTIEPKGKDAFQIKNHVRLLVSSNNTWIIPAGLEERRFFVVDVGEKHMQDRPYFQKIVRQMDNGGREALLHYLLNYDLSDIDLGVFPMTIALFENKLHSMPPFQKFWFRKLEAGAQLNNEDHWIEGIVPVEQFQNEFFEFIGFKKTYEDKTSIGIELRKLVPWIYRKQPTGPDGVRYYAYQFPPLKECRKFWEERIRMKIEWPEEGYSLSNPNKGLIQDVVF